MTSGADQVPPPVQAVRALTRVARVLERSCDELPLAHYRVLCAIGTGDARASRVAARLAVGRPAVSAAVAALTRRGLVVRGDEAGDRRAAALSLTTEGQALLERSERGMAERVEQLCALTPDPAALLAALGALGGAIERMHAERAAAGHSAGGR